MFLLLSKVAQEQKTRARSHQACHGRNCGWMNGLQTTCARRQRRQRRQWLPECIDGKRPHCNTRGGQGNGRGVRGRLAGGTHASPHYTRCRRRHLVCCSAAGDVTGKAACTHVALANRDFRGWASRRC